MLHLLFKSIVAGLAGAALVCVPFIIYFTYKNCLYDMFYAAFIYNMKYVSDGMEYINLSFTVANITPLALLICYSIISIKRRNNKQIIIVWIPILLSYIYIYYLTFAFIHYFSIFLPAYALAVIELCDWCKENKLGLNVGLIGITYVILINGLVLCTEVLNYNYLYARRGPGWDDDEKTACELYEMVPKGSSFASINEPVQHVIYIKYDVLPQIKYFYYQDTVANIDTDIIDDMVNSFKENEPEYVLYSEGRDITIHPGVKLEDSIYKNVLQEDYTVVEAKASYTNSDGEIILLKRNH